jgi:hypothetical protein
MDRLSNSDSLVTQPWNPVTLRNAEDGDDTISKMLFKTRTTQYKVPEGRYNWYRHESIPEDSVLWP